MFDGPSPVRFAAFMHTPSVVGYLVGLAQVAGGLAILTGVLIRIGAACVIVVMLGAIFLVHLAHGFDINEGGVEYGLTQLLMAPALSLAGAGRYSLAASLPACPENSKRKQKALRIGNSRRAQKEYLLGEEYLP